MYCFRFSCSSQVDDIVEEQKLSSSHRVSFPWQPEIWAGSSEVVGEEGSGGGGGGGGGRDTPAQLRELLKMEREQKVISQSSNVMVHLIYQDTLKMNCQHLDY